MSLIMLTLASSKESLKSIILIINTIRYVSIDAFRENSMASPFYAISSAVQLYTQCKAVTLKPNHRL